MLSSCSSFNKQENVMPGEMPVVTSAPPEMTLEREPSSSEKLDKCIVRLNENCNNLSGNNEERIADNVEKCKHLEYRSTKMELLQLRNVDKMIVIKTNGNEIKHKQCSMIKYEIDHSGIKDFKIVGSLAFMISNDGQVYYMVKDTFHELLNSKGKSYKNVDDLKGSSNGKSVTLQFKDNNEFVITREELERKIDKSQTRKLDFKYTTSARSIFRDE